MELVSMYNNGHYSEVVITASLLLEEYPENFMLWNLLGVAEQALGRISNALSCFKRVVENNPKYADGFNNLGVALKNRGETSDAIEAFTKAIALRSDYVDAYNNLGSAYRAQGDIVKAIAIFTKAIDISPNSAQVYNNLGNAFLAKNDLQNALAALKQAIDISPGYAEAQNNLGNVYKALGKTKLALEAYERAIVIRPTYAVAHNNIGTVHTKDQNFESAILAFKKALEINPDYVEAQLNLSNAKTRAIPAWHISMMNDQSRNNAYLDAINLAIGKNDFVFEIGTGSGLLAMMAARAGARKVITCEASELIAHKAREIIDQNGYSEVINVLSKKSTDVVVGKDLPQKADVLLSEILSGEFVGEGVRPTISDASKRLVREGGKIIPQSGAIRIALIGGEQENLGEFYVSEANGFDLTKFNSITPNKHSIKFTSPPTLLSSPVSAYEIKMSDIHKIADEEKVITLTAKESGLCYGIVQWLKVQIFQDIIYENEPGKLNSHWPTPVYRFAEPINLVLGQEVKIKAKLFEDYVWFQQYK